VLKARSTPPITAAGDRSGGMAMAEGSETKRRKVLVVDGPDMRLLLRMVLEKAGHEVVEAHNGRAALERVHESRPDVLIKGRMMPG
jgi:CheY-like chemotaxis protein